MNISKRFLQNFYGIRPPNTGSDAPIYQDKFTRQDGESMTSHYLRYANLAANLQAAMSEENRGSIDLALPHCGSKTLDK
jgi:hypothetical protein